MSLTQTNPAAGTSPLDDLIGYEFQGYGAAKAKIEKCEKRLEKYGPLVKYHNEFLQHSQYKGLQDVCRQLGLSPVHLSETRLKINKFTLEGLYLDHIFNLYPSMTPQMSDLSFPPSLSGLKELKCSGISLKSLDVGKLADLRVLECNTNAIGSLDLSNQPNLESLSCYNNRLPGLDVSYHANLKSLNCGRNPLEYLDLRGCEALNSLSCSRTKLQKLDLSDTRFLEYLYCFEGELTELDIHNLSKLRYLFCGGNNLTEIDISGLGQLENVRCVKGNQLSFKSKLRLRFSGVKSHDW